MTRFWLRYSLQMFYEISPSIVNVKCSYFSMHFYKYSLIGWSNNSSQLIRSPGLAFNILLIKFWLISDTLLICLGNAIYWRRITDFNSTTFFALNGGLNKLGLTFHRASNRNRHQESRYLLCCCIIDFEELQVPC